MGLLVSTSNRSSHIFGAFSILDAQPRFSPRTSARRRSLPDHTYQEVLELIVEHTPAPMSEPPRKLRKITFKTRTGFTSAKTIHNVLTECPGVAIAFRSSGLCIQKMCMVSKEIKSVVLQSYHLKIDGIHGADDPLPSESFWGNCEIMTFCVTVIGGEWCIDHAGPDQGILSQGMRPNAIDCRELEAHKCNIAAQSTANMSRTISI